ncbi:MAG: DUF3667 domain-containing protein [Sphingomonadaceae bacterium]
MSEFGEGLGTAIEGGALAGAVEKERPGAGAADDGFTHEGSCLNCGTELIGAHCHVCGQKAHLHRSLRAVAHDLVHGVLHLDGKLWRTLPLLAWKPGELMRRYLDGERAKFVSPMAMFLFSVFLMFAVFQMVGISTPTDIKSPVGSREELVSARTQVEEQLAAAREKVEQAGADAQARIAAERELADRQEALENLEKVEAVVVPDVNDADVEWNVTGVKAIDKGIIKKWSEHPELMLYKLQANSYKFSWLLIPLSIPFVWLMFAWRRRFHAYDHAVFVTYSLAFMSLLLIVLSVLGKTPLAGPWLLLALIVIAPLHIYKQLRAGYEITRFSALWRTSALVLVVIFVVLALFLQILLLLGAL